MSELIYRCENLSQVKQLTEWLEALNYNCGMVRSRFNLMDDDGGWVIIQSNKITYFYFTAHFLLNQISQDYPSCYNELLVDLVTLCLSTN